MKQFLAVAVLFVALFAMPSCKEVDDNDGKTRVIQDSLINVLPTWQALHIRVSEDRSEMTIVVGDATFYKATDEVKNKKALEVGKMVLRIYGPDNYLKKGTLIVTQDVSNKSETPPDGISTPIDFEGLKKVVYPK
jgi:hypothetical protein